jgi:hypothetical protein
MNNKLLSYKASLFHAQNIPAKWKLLWKDFICCIDSGEGNFEVLTAPDGTEAIRPNLLVDGNFGYLYILRDEGIWYVDHDGGKIKPTNKTDLEFTWGAVHGGRTWFSGPGLGLWYAEQSDPYVILQSSVTAGTFTAIGYHGAGWGDLTTISPFFSDVGWYTYNQTSKTLIAVTSPTKDFKYSAGPLSFGATGAGNAGIWTIAGSTNIVQKVSSGNFYGAAAAPDSSVLIFREGGGIYRAMNVAYSSATVNFLSGSDGIIVHHGAIARNGKLYLCTDAGIKIYNESALSPNNTNISTGVFHYCAVAQNGILYFCGDAGVFHLNDSTGEILATTETNEYIQCILSDSLFYFIDNQNVVRYNIAGNTGASVAEKLEVRKTRFGKEEIVETFSMLDHITPHITIENLRRLSEQDILQRATDVLNAVPEQHSPPSNDAYNPDSAGMCPINKFGFISSAIKGRMQKTFGAINDVAWNSQYLNAHGGYFGQDKQYYTRIHALYIDNIPYLSSETIAVICNANNLPRGGSLVFGLIEYPPEQWNMGRTPDSYNDIHSKMIANAKTKTYPAFTNANNIIIEIPIAEIYNGPNAKTLVCYNPNESADNIMTVVAWYINDQTWNLELYKLVLFDWSNRVNQTSGGNAIAKTLTKTIAVVNIITTYDVLDAFPGYAQITEATYVQMTDGDVNDRANALMDYAAAQDGRTTYRKNNEVIE